MKRHVLIAAAALFALSLAGLAQAGTATPRIDRREARQQVRIQQGVRSGRLTPREFARLERGQRHIHRMEWRAKSDGRMSMRERRHIGRAQNHENRMIRRFRHNGRMA